MSHPSVVIDILHSCVIHNIAALTIYTQSNKPDYLCFEVKDNLKLLPQDGYLSGYKPLDILGEFHISEGITEANITSLIDELLAEISEAYLVESLSASLTERNAQHGLN